MSRRTLSLVALVVALLLALTVSAVAYLTAGGSGSTSASVATLPVPTITSATAGSSSVRLEWSAVTPPAAAGELAYYVTRDGGAPAGTCPTAASPRAVTSCTDSGLSLARHDYTVTAVWRSWTGRSASASATVTHGPATQLVFTTQPGGGATGGLAFPNQPVVTARDAGGNTVTDYAGSVELSIRSGGAAGAVLSGCSATLTNGVTRFSGCEIDRSSGTSYVLRARDGTLGVDSAGFTVTTGAVAQLVFTTQPGNGTAGRELSPQPVVRAADAGGNLIGSSYTGTVTLSIVPGTGTAGATLTDCSSSRSSGVTTFDNCEIDRSGSGYQLRATDRALSISGDSTTFTVSAGSVATLAYTTQPGGGATGGLAFPTQPVVTALDSLGNVATSYASTVRLSIRSGTGTSGAVLSGCVGSLRSGVTTFTGCAIDRSGSGYQLRATDMTRTVDSSSFNVSVGPLARLAFTTSPSGAVAGTAFTTQPAVTGTDAGGNAVAGYSGTVTLSIAAGTGTAGATLSGCSSTLASGVTTFRGCSIDRSGSTYRLHADDGTLSGDSATFTVSAGAVATLAFTTQPGGATGGSQFSTQPVVTAFDALGNVATSYSGTVTLAIVAGTGTAGADLDNCDDSRVNGVTTFDDCEIDRVGTGYVLRASDGTRTVDSAAFAVTPGRAVSLLLTAATTRPVAGAANDLTISALDAGGNVATSYTGAKSLAFGGANSSLAGNAPTVTNSAGTPIAFGTATSITFVDGVASASGGANGTMVLRAAGSDEISVDQGSLDNDGDELAVDVLPGAPARLAWTSVSAGTVSNPCYFTCTKSSASDDGTFQARVAVTDTDGNIVSAIGSGHSVTVSTPPSGAGSGGRFTAPTAGTSVTLAIPSTGSAITSSSFTFRFASGSWTTHTFSANPVSPDGYTAATATIIN